MALMDLERLTSELEYLAEILRSEARPAARLIIIKRVHEIMDSIGEEFNAE